MEDALEDVSVEQAAMDIISKFSAGDRQAILMGMLESIIAMVHEGSHIASKKTPYERAISIQVLLTMFKDCLNEEGLNLLVTSLEKFNSTLLMECSDTIGISLN